MSSIGRPAMSASSTIARTSSSRPPPASSMQRRLEISNGPHRSACRRRTYRAIGAVRPFPSRSERTQRRCGGAGRDRRQARNNGGESPTVCGCEKRRRPTRRQI
jgi:hypothetical protein